MTALLGIPVDRLREISVRHVAVFAASEELAFAPLVNDDNVAPEEMVPLMLWRAGSMLSAIARAAGISFPEAAVLLINIRGELDR